MQRLIACSEDGFAFGEPDQTILRNYEYLLPEDCLPLSAVRKGREHPQYGYRYKLLWDGITSFIQDSEWESLNEDWDVRLFRVALVVIPDGPLFMDIRREVMAKDERMELLPASTGMHFQFYIPATATDQTPFIWPAIGKAYDIPAALGPGDTDLTMATSWLEECITGNGKHQICGKLEGTPLLPTRVIDVGSSGADPHLHTSEPGERSHYVALSHCWGGSIPIMSTTVNLPEFVQRLPSEIPKTFADAMAVTRAMGQKYLWLDSLCILQDSVADWAEESSRMDQVYSQALFTIMADAAGDSFAGFLEPPSRNVRKTSVITCDLPSTDTSSQASVHVRQRGDLAFQLPYHDFHSDGPWSDPWEKKEEELIPRSKLSTRAWAFQERLLSPRTLHFGPSEMAWECRGLCTCECSATNERTSRTASLLKSSIALHPIDAPSDKSAHALLRSHDNAWQKDIVEEYTALGITKDTDRLPGLAGLATRASNLRPGDQYMAGMWRETIKTGLSWYTMPEQPSRRIPSENRFPTWSWASVSGQIRHARVAGIPSDAPLLDVLSVQYTSDAKSPIGAGPQTPASLLASGYLVPIDSIWFQPFQFAWEDQYALGSGNSYRACYRIKWAPKIALPENCVAMMDIHKATPANDNDIRLDRLEGMEPDNSGLVMLLTALAKGVVYGLVLNPRHADGNGSEYERVGFVNGQDAIGEFASWSSSSYSAKPLYEQDWDPEDNGGLMAILEQGGISKTQVKIW
ncbi:heterokaryon incompatibility protein-domain-containing protein [Xylariomycetidae sp. FL2044]|nr:heterokaryon incompatibility protein-domain-containing protein [Xylariomycetidae sp. FL2044]